VPEAIDPRAFRDAMGLFATGVAIIVTEVGEEVHAMTANALTSLSLEPRQLLFCPGKRARLAQHLPAMQRFSVNFLREDQRALSSYFAGGWKESAPPPFRFVPSAAGPRLEGSLVCIGCETRQVVDGGDHWIVIGEVMTIHRGIEPLKPLLFFRGQYRSVDVSAGGPAPDITQVEDEPPHIFYGH
jgi:flavin reductase (DIM6/NTAB) family NADH-FMN oxidoreductase RutF